MHLGAINLDTLILLGVLWLTVRTALKDYISK